jgi:hypothetical protein
MKKLILFLLLCAFFAQAQTVPPSYFGQHLLHLTRPTSSGVALTPWPTIGLGALRTWDMGVSWFNINTSSGVYYYTNLDAAINDAQVKGVDLIYTFGNTPTWASSNPTDLSCSEGLGACDSPSSNIYWQHFVTSIVTHVAGKIHYWEIWNEPNVGGFWRGTTTQMVTMASQAYAIIKSIDPSAVVLSPAATDDRGVLWMSDYLTAGGGAYMNVLAFHGYYLPTDTPEHITTRAAAYQNLLAAHSLSISMWDTEWSWGTSTNMSSTSDQANFLARTYLLQWPSGVQRAYWYGYDAGSCSGCWGDLWTTSGGLNDAGIAYQQVYNWMVGATMALGACTNSGTVYQCVLMRSGGYQGLAVWNTSGTSTFTVPTQYKQYRDLTGATTSVGGTVSIGKAPILLENTGLTPPMPPSNLFVNLR